MSFIEKLLGKTPKTLTLSKEKSKTPEKMIVLEIDKELPDHINMEKEPTTVMEDILIQSFKEARTIVK